MTQRNPSPLHASARAASRWLWISAFFDALPVAAAVIIALVMMKKGADPTFFVFLFIIGGVVAAVMVANALWKLRAGRRIRKGIADEDGELFSSAFVPLRRAFVVTFVMYAFSTLTLLAQGC
jgi:uncharacterized membrane protein YbhN (UPF0104 family)